MKGRGGQEREKEKGKGRGWEGASGRETGAGTGKDEKVFPPILDWIYALVLLTVVVTYHKRLWNKIMRSERHA